MQTSTTQNEQKWHQLLANRAAVSDPAAGDSMTMSIACDSRSGHAAFYLPEDTDHVHARCLRYVRTFAKQNGFRLGRDRRQKEMGTVTDLRNRRPPLIALGLSLLLKQTGLPGAARKLSRPHTLNEPDQEIAITDLIQMAAFASEKSKRVVVLPNRILINALQDTQPICAYGCKLQYRSGRTILSHFDSSYFRAYGYSTGSQYVVHICLGGGFRNETALWTQLPVLNNVDFNFRLFPGRTANDDYGLFYITFIYDMVEAPVPWWVTARFSDTQVDEAADSETETLKAG